MTISDRQSGNEMEGPMQERIAELEKANQMLRAEILERNRIDEALRQSEQRTKLKLETILSPARETANLELAEIVDIQAIQSLMDDFYKLTHIPVSLNDLKSNVLIGIGWQDICTKFHRVHPESCKHCVESSIKLSVGVSPGEFQLYRCKNNMWDITTPIMLGGEQVGILFSGQFFFEDEPLDYELFRSQAKKYDFNEKEYMAALEKVPRLSRETVNKGMAFLVKLANMISQLSYSNIKLARSLAERDALMDSLRGSEAKYRQIVETSQEGIWLIDSNERTVFVNQKISEMLGYSIEEIMGQSPRKFMSPESRAKADDRLREHIQGVNCVFDYRFTRRDGSDLWCILSSSPFFDDQGKYAGSLAMITDITERKRAEEALQESEEKHRNIVETANEGVWIFNSVSETTYVNEKMAEMLGYDREEMIGRFIWDFAEEAEKGFFQLKLANRKQGIDEVYELKLLRKEGSYLWLLVSAKAFFDKDGKFAGSLGMFTDITERKQEEHRICRYNRILEGINSIFSNVVQAKTEEELGNACLSVAVEMTGSQFGFINEMGADGLLHDVAKSELAWEQCFMYDKTGHRRPPADFLVHGLYGSVIINEKSFFTNNPQSHPDSIGVPPGHPALTSFLGVPLVQNGKTVGLIAVANRENGYSSEQQEDLEAIAPAVMQVQQRKKAEEALRLSTVYNRSLIEASLDPLVTIGRDGKITDVNDATEHVTGYSRNYLIGTDFSDNFTEPEKARKGYQQVFKDGEVRDYPLEIQHKDGHVTPVLYNASVYRDESGEVIGVFAAARDIAERKKAEEALKLVHDNLEKLVGERTAQLEMAYNLLKESEEGLAEAQKMAHIGNWRWNIETHELYWSDEIYRIFGLKPQELRVTYDLFLNYLHPDDRDYLIHAIKEGLNGKPCPVDYRIIRADGEERIVHTEAESIFYEENIPIQVKGIVQDITERKKAEEKIKTLANALESSNDAIVTESLEGIITNWNKGAEQIYGYSAEDILGKDVSILEPSNLKGEIQQLIEMIKQGERVKHYETSRLKKDGTIINVSVTLSPIFGTSGELVAISAISRDITERKRAEEAFRESETRLRRFYESDMFGVFYYNMDGSITDDNDKFLEIVGYTRKDLHAGELNWVKMTPPEYRLQDEQAIKELKTTGSVKKTLEKEYIRKNGSRVPIILGISTFDQAIREGFCFVLDNTEKKKTEKAMAEIDKVRIKEIHHRIKNNLQVISSLLDLQAEKFGYNKVAPTKKVLEAFSESQNRIISMSLIHEELYKGAGNDTLDFSAYLRKLTESLFQTYSLSSKNIHLSMDLEENAFFDMDTAVPLGIIVNELVSNSLKHRFSSAVYVPLKNPQFLHQNL